MKIAFNEYLRKYIYEIIIKAGNLLPMLKRKTAYGV